MSNFYIVYPLKRYLALFILLFVAGDLMAQFSVTEKCVPSPECAEDGTVFTDDSKKVDIVGWNNCRYTNSATCISATGNLYGEFEKDF